MNAKRSGFTLVEMVVVCGIISVIAAMAIPSILVSTNAKLTATARTVMADLLYAQSQASTMQSNCYVVFTPASGNAAAKYELQSPLGTRIARPTGANVATMGNSTAELPNATLDTLPSGGLTLGFDSLGQPFTVSSGSTTIPTSAIRVPLKSPDGTCALALSVQPFTGEITAQ